MAYPPKAQDERTPLQVPIAIGSALWYTCVMCCVEGFEDERRSVMVVETAEDDRTGDGRCSLVEAIFSPGDSNATTGAPNVTPSKEASAPPSEWPMTQIFESGYM